MGLLDSLSKVITGRTIRAANANPVLSFVLDIGDFANLDAEILTELERAGTGATLVIDADTIATADGAKLAERLFLRGHEFAVHAAGAAAGVAALSRAVPDAFVSTVLASGKSSLAKARDFSAVVSRKSGINAGVLNLGDLHSETLTAGREIQAREALDAAIAKQGWAIFVIPASGAPQTEAAQVRALCEHALAQNVEILTIRNGLGAVGWDRNWA